MFDAFPKKRPEVDKEKLQRLYENYEQNRLRKTAAARLSGLLEGWMHRKVAADVKGREAKSTLEIGAGSLNHLKFETVTVYDIVEPWEKLWTNSIYLNHIRNKYDDICQIPRDIVYERIISIATFEHLLNLPEIVAQCCLHLTANGCLRVAIPNEGSFVWTLCWRISTGLEYFLRTGEDYGLIMKYEHVNTADEIENVLRFFFSDVKKSLFGISNQLSVYRFYECQMPQVEKAIDFLKASIKY